MRVVGGTFKGKKLFFINSKITRPLRDLVKESIFNIIKHSKLVDAKIEDSYVLDLYAGIGSFGIECISRKAKSVTFIEEDFKALKELNKNIKNLSIDKLAKVFASKINLCLDRLAFENKFDIFFLDPPFAKYDYKDDLMQIKKLNIFNRKHLVIIHREKKTTEDLNDILKIIKIKKYGRSKIVFATFY